MPQIIQYIDAIARKKKRAVLFIGFGPQDKSADMFSDNSYDYFTDERRTEVLEWLTQNNILWEKCGPFVTASFCFGYLGDVYLDIPYNVENEQYQLVREYIENPDGSMRDERVTWYYLPLEHAMKNAYQDEPGFWENFWD